MMFLGPKLRMLRQRRELTQDDISNATGIGRVNLSHYETSASYPSAEVLLRLAQFYNVSADYLLGLSDDPKIELERLTDDQMALILELARQYQLLNAQVKTLIKKTEAG